MLVPLEKEPLPVAETNGDISVLWQRLVHDRLPGFVVHATWPTSDEAVEALTPYLQADGFIVQNDDRTFEHLERPDWHRRLPKFMRPKKGNPFTRPFVGYEGITGWHLDGLPTLESVSAVEIHHTEQGIVRASFVEPTSEYSRKHMYPSITTYNGNGQLFLKKQRDLPDEVYAQLRKGSEVDDAVVIPVLHTAVAEPGTTIISRSLGEQPLVHSYESLSIPRVSRTLGFELVTITPAYEMNTTAVVE